MKALIVEDEKMARDNLARTLTSSFPDIEVVGTASSVAGTLAWLRDPAHSADVIFMDVELSDGDCFEIFRQERITAKVIMTTAYDSYAVKAFEAGSVDYLLKPIDPAALHRAVDRCRERSGGVDVDALMQALGRREQPEYKERFVVSVGERIIPVKTSDIAYFYSKDKYNYLADTSGAHTSLTRRWTPSRRNSTPGNSSASRGAASYRCRPSAASPASSAGGCG